MKRLEQGYWKGMARKPLPPELLAKPVFIMDGHTHIRHHHPTQVRCPHGYIKLTTNEGFFDV